MEHVYIVQHSRSLGDGDEETKLIGVYSSERKAQDAVARAMLLPGFGASPDDFAIDKYVIDNDHWNRWIHFRAIGLADLGLEQVLVIHGREVTSPGHGQNAGRGSRAHEEDIAMARASGRHGPVAPERG